MKKKCTKIWFFTWSLHWYMIFFTIYTNLQISMWNLLSEWSSIVEV
jgi:hypothetical protein